MDNICLVGDLFDVSKFCNIDLGIMSVKEEKAFDSVDYNFLFTVLEVFGGGKSVVSWIKLL